MRRGGIWVFSNVWGEKGMMRKLCKKAKGKSLCALFLASQTPGFNLFYF